MFVLLHPILRAKSCTVGVVQLVRAPDCGSGGRGFEPHLPPSKAPKKGAFFVYIEYGDVANEPH